MLHFIISKSYLLCFSCRHRLQLKIKENEEFRNNRCNLVVFEEKEEENSSKEKIRRYSFLFPTEHAVKRKKLY